MARQSAIDYLNNRFSELSTIRSSQTSDWQQLIKNFSPFRGRFSRSDNRRKKNKNRLSNNTPVFAKRTLAAGMMSGITSPSRPWFRFGTPDPDMNEFGPVREWLDQVEKKVYQVFNASNLYRTLPNMYEALGVMGTACIFDDDDFNTISTFQQYPTGEYLLDIGINGVVNTFGREYQLSVSQLIEKFGLDNISPSVRTNYDNGNYSTMIDVNQLIEPRLDLNKYEEFDIDDMFSNQSVYFEPGRSPGNSGEFLGVKGYHEFPVYGPRWEHQTGDVYGVGPGHESLGDAKALQVQEKEKGKAIAKMVAPPMVAPTSSKRANLSVLPGQFNFSDDPNKVFKPAYQVDPRVSELNLDIERTEDRINRAFYVDLFMMISNMAGIQPRNELELMQREQEKLLQLGSVLETVHVEVLKPLIDRTFNKLVRLSEPGWGGMTDKMVIPPPPEELQGKEIKVEFISVLAQAQKAVATGTVDRWVGFVTNLSQFKPDALDLINEDEMVEQYGEDLGIPNNLVRPSDEVKKTRDSRKAQEQSLLQQEQMAQGSQTAKTAAETVSTLQ